MSARETILNGQHILAIEAATPTGLDLELRINRRRVTSVVVSRQHQQVLAINDVPTPSVLVGRITDALHCLFVGPAAIDITPATAAAIDAWLGRQLQVISA